MQISPTNRSEIPEYSKLEEALGSAAGRINGKYGKVSWTPIRYVNRVYSRSVLAGLYRTARVARSGHVEILVTATETQAPGIQRATIYIKARRETMAKVIGRAPCPRELSSRQ